MSKGMHEKRAGKRWAVSFPALCLALILSFGSIWTQTPAMAAESDTEIQEITTTSGSITVSQLEAGVTVTIYRIAEVTFDYELQQTKDPVYVWADAVAAWLQENETYADFLDTTTYEGYFAVAESFRVNLSSATTTDGEEEETSDEEGSDEEGSDEEGSDEAGSDEEGSDENDADTSDQEDLVTAAAAAAFYDALASAIKGYDADAESLEGTIDPSELVSVTLTAQQTLEDGETAALVTFENLEMGTYLILVEDGVRIYSPAVVNIVPVWDTDSAAWVLEAGTADMSVCLKSESVGILKMVSDSLEEQGAATVGAAIGDTVYFTLIADVPDYPDRSISKTLVIADTLSDGLTLDSASVCVYGICGEELSLLSEEDGAYVLNTEAATLLDGETEVTFTITFSYDSISSYDQIEVTYAALVNEDAVTGPEDPNTNEAVLQYSNNPYEENVYAVTEVTEPDLETGSLGTKANIYAYGVEITKVDAEDYTQALSGAEFTLEKKGSEEDEENEVLYFIQTGDGTYRLAVCEDAEDQTAGYESGAVSTLVVSEGTESEDGTTGQGILTITGLDTGTYILTETKAPDGYNLATTSTVFEILDADTDGRPTLDDGTDEYETGIVTIQLTNRDTRSFTLPQTGGIGTFVFTAGGVTLMGAALLIFLFRRRRQKTKEQLM